MRVWVISTIGILLAAAAAPQLEPRIPLTPNGKWELLRVGDCAEIRFKAPAWDDDDSLISVVRRWSGRCGADGLITGSGRMVVTIQAPGFGQTVNGQPVNARIERRGTAVRGILTGEVTEDTYRSFSGPPEFEFSGVDHLENGCVLDPDNGRPDDEDCSPETGLRVSAEVSARGALTYFEGS